MLRPAGGWVRLEAAPGAAYVTGAARSGGLPQQVLGMFVSE
jgi:hypothetical protein